MELVRHAFLYCFWSFIRLFRGRDRAYGLTPMTTQTQCDITIIRTVWELVHFTIR